MLQLYLEKTGLRITACKNSKTSLIRFTYMYPVTHIYNDTLHLPTFSESNAWDFRLVMTGISENVPATSEDFEQFYEDCWTLLKMFKNVPMNFEHFWSYLKDNNFSVFNFVRSQSHHSMPFWNIFVEVNWTFIITWVKKVCMSQRPKWPELILVSLAWSMPRRIATPPWMGC